MSSQELIILASCISCSISSILVILILVYYLNTNQGKPEDTQGKPEDTQGKPEDTQGKPEDTQGKPEDTQGKPEDTQGKPDGVSALTVFCVGSADWGNQKTTAGKTISRDCPGGEKITQLCKSDGNWANVGTCKSIENGKCALNEDCKDFTLIGPGLACDNGTCKKKVKDSLGIFYKPSECKGSCFDTGSGYVDVTCTANAEWGNQKTTAGKTISRDCPGGEKVTALCTGKGNFTEVGTCKSIENGKCALNEDCKDFTLVGPGLACDNGTCKKKVKDSLGIFYKPSECKGPCFDTGAGNLETTCTANAEWGNQKTTAGNKISRVCPGGETVTALCKGDGNWADVGTCKSIENGKCNVNEDCKDFTLVGPGLACDNGTCKKKVKDWFGIFYKPSECTGPCSQTI